MSEHDNGTPATLEVKDLHATVEGKEILQAASTWWSARARRMR